jgi:Phage capsid family
MTIAQRVSEFSQSADRQARVGEFLMGARALLASWDVEEARSFLRLHHATERCREGFEAAHAVIGRAATPAGVTYDSSWAGPLATYELSATAFAESLRDQSCFDRALTDNAFLRVPPQRTVAIVTAGATAAQVNEAAPSSASVMAFTSANVTMVKLICFVVLSSELMKMAGPGAVQLIRRDLSRSVSQAVDTYFLGLLFSGIVAIPSSGSNSVAIRNDLRDLLDAVTFGSNAKLYYVMTPQIAKRLAVVGDSVGGRMFPGMTPTGGELDGVPALVCEAASAGTISLFDASQVAVSSGPIELDRSSAAILNLDSAPDSPPSASTPYVNLFAQNLSALRCTRYVGASRLRSTAAATVSGFLGVGSSPA